MQKPDFWTKHTVKTLILRPLSWLYVLLRWAHRRCRLWGRYWAGVPVISVGNITVGGSGKTPFVAKLAAHFATEGKMVAVLCRGYGGQQRLPLQVTPDMPAARVGDEPLMLLKALEGQAVQVWVGRDRVALAKRAEAAGADIFILDDGFQYDPLARDVDIVMIQASYGYGNGLCLPAGPLREPVSALKRADFGIVLNENAPLSYWGLPAYRLYTSAVEADLKHLKGKPVHAFAGIAHPDAFFEMLGKAGLDVQKTSAFTDHHLYTAADVQALQASGLTLVTTSKDAVKLPPDFAHTVRIDLNGDDWQEIVTDIQSKLI